MIIIWRRELQSLPRAAACRVDWPDKKAWQPAPILDHHYPDKSYNSRKLKGPLDILKVLQKPTLILKHHYLDTGYTTAVKA